MEMQSLLVHDPAYPSKLDMHSHAKTAIEATLESQSALPLYVHLKAVQEVIGAMLKALQQPALDEAFAETGGAMGRAALYRGAEITLRNLPAKYIGYSDAVLELEAKIEELGEELKRLRKIDQLQGTARKESQGATLSVTFGGDK